MTINMLFSELYKIMVNKVTFRGFWWGRSALGSATDTMPALFQHCLIYRTSPNSNTPDRWQLSTVFFQSQPSQRFIYRSNQTRTRIDNARHESHCAYLHSGAGPRPRASEEVHVRWRVKILVANNRPRCERITVGDNHKH